MSEIFIEAAMNALAKAEEADATSLSETTAEAIEAALVVPAEFAGIAAYSDPNIKPEVVTKMVEFLQKFVDKAGIDHPAIAKEASEHTPEEMQQVLGVVGIKVEAKTAQTNPYIPTLDEAKRIVREANPVVEVASMKKTKAGKGHTAKPPKASKASKEPKAKAEKKVVEIVPAEVIEVDAATHKLPEAVGRANFVPKPEKFYLEPGDQRPTKQVHQVDGSRLQGCAPVMPNVELLISEGNPYPLVADGTVQTSDRYKPFVAISHFTYGQLAAAGELRDHPESDVINAILEQAGVKNDSDARLCIQDTLRDLALYGLCRQFMQGRSRIFRIEKTA
jgi:hypothetical protein